MPSGSVRPCHRLLNGRRIRFSGHPLYRTPREEALQLCSLLVVLATEEESARRELQHALTMEQAAKADALAAAAAAAAAKSEVLGRLAAAEGTRKAALRRLAVQQEHKDMLAQQQVLLRVENR